MLILSGKFAIGVLLIICVAAMLILFGLSQALGAFIVEHQYTIDFSERRIRRKIIFSQDFLTGLFQLAYDFGGIFNLKSSPTVRFDAITRIELRQIRGSQAIYVAMKRWGITSSWFMWVPEGKGEQIYSELRKQVPSAR